MRALVWPPLSPTASESTTFTSFTGYREPTWWRGARSLRDPSARGRRRACAADGCRQAGLLVSFPDRRNRAQGLFGLWPFPSRMKVSARSVKRLAITTALSPPGCVPPPSRGKLALSRPQSWPWGSENDSAHVHLVIFVSAPGRNRGDHGPPPAVLLPSFCKTLSPPRAHLQAAQVQRLYGQHAAVCHAVHPFVFTG